VFIAHLFYTRIIPTGKAEVKLRDHGQCVQCGSKNNLHFDHDISFSKGGSSLTAANVRLLCAKHNLEKSDKILSVTPWIFTGAAAVTHIQKLSG
jgi:5-methylcytosine-specific restriction endonuclease McrA